ncbi:MAG: ATP-binding protein [Gammaproteobacteria bacterium]
MPKDPYGVGARSRESTIKPPKSLLRPVGRAIGDYGMIQHGDRILVAVSGGKDSLTLLHILRHLNRYAPVRFELAAITVDPQINGFDPSHLQSYMAGLGMPYFYRSQPIAEQAAAHMQGTSFCAYCARMKRGVMYTTAREHGHNVLALGQHLDDLAESFLMSAFHGGRLQTMKAHYLSDAGDVRVIRPLVYVRERQCAEFARQVNLPVIPDSCPACFRMPTQRAYMKSLLAREERVHKNLMKTLLSAMRPLMGGSGSHAVAAGGRPTQTRASSPRSS